MTTTTHCTLETLGDALEEAADGMVEDFAEVLTEGLTLIQEQIVEEAPRLAGDFAASIRPYRGEPGHTWQRGGGGGDAGAAEVAAVMQDWKPGDEVGIATDAPQSRKLIFHAGERVGTVGRGKNRRQARTFTKKVGAGWVDRIVEDANRRMEAE